MFHVTRNAVLNQISVTSRRFLRNLIKKERNSPKLLKGRVVNLDNRDISPIEEVKELNLTLGKMFLQPHDMQSSEGINLDDKFQSVYENVDQTSEMTKMHDSNIRRTIKRQIIKKKYFQESKETNLLTYAAKRQIRYLHNMDSLEWTAEKLSTCFPISVEGCKKLLKNNFHIPQDAIEAHDAKVMKRWQILKSNIESNEISPVTMKLWKSGKLVQDFYSSNINLPQPLEPVCEKSRIGKPMKVGEHFAIIKRYLDFKNQDLIHKQNSNITKIISTNTNKDLDQFKDNIHLQNIKKFSSESETDDHIGYVAEKREDNDPDIMLEQYKQNLLEEFHEKPQKSEVDDAYFEWLKNQHQGLKKESNVTHYDENPDVQTIKKTNVENLELTVETSYDQKISYLHEKDGGYEKCDEDWNGIKRFIKIPSHLYKKNALYRVGQCFYDDHGNFLYRVPYKLN